MQTEPVLFLVFNRPDTTARVFAAIRKARPERLYVAGDGPRKDRAGEAELCSETRRIATAVDWPCKVKTLFRDENLGCGKAVSGAISWFFENEPEGIILEDDCLPHPDFFPYCAEMLEKYRDDKRVMFIGGTNFQDGIKRGAASYYFSSHSHVWGWASWRRAWADYDFEMGKMDLNGLRAVMSAKGFNQEQSEYWTEIFNKMKKHAIDTWDYQWQFSIWFSGGVSVIPNSTVITNIGVFGTHYDGAGRNINIPSAPILPLLHPDMVLIDRDADVYFHNAHIGNHRSIIAKIVPQLQCILRKWGISL